MSLVLVFCVVLSAESLDSEVQAASEIIVSIIMLYLISTNINECKCRADRLLYHEVMYYGRLDFSQSMTVYF